MADWVTISSLATASGPLVLAAATFASVRSANRAARVAERSLSIGLRPVLVPSRPEDRTERVSFADGRVITLPGGKAALEESDGVVYMALPLRNIGAGLAVLHGWYVREGMAAGGDPHPGPHGVPPIPPGPLLAPGGTRAWAG